MNNLRDNRDSRRKAFLQNLIALMKVSFRLNRSSLINAEFNLIDNDLIRRLGLEQKGV